MKYDYLSIEKKWQQKWDEAHIFEAKDGKYVPLDEKDIIKNNR